MTRHRKYDVGILVVGQEDGRFRAITQKELDVMPKKKKQDLGIIKPVVGESVVQKTASGAGPHDKPKRKKRRQERREKKRKLQNGEFE